MEAITLVPTSERVFIRQNKVIKIYMRLSNGYRRISTMETILSQVTRAKRGPLYNITAFIVIKHAGLGFFLFYLGSMGCTNMR